MGAPLHTDRRRRSRSSLVALSLVASVGWLGSGCTSSSAPATTTTTTLRLTGFAAQSPDAILAAACGATLPVRSVSVASSFAQPALVGDLTSMVWTMTTAANQGVLHFGKKVLVEVIVVPNVTYVRAPAAWWATTSVSASQRTLAGRWIAISSQSASAALVAPLAAWGNLSSTLAVCTETSRTLATGSLTTIGGTSLIELTAAIPGATQHLWIPTLTIPYVARSVRSDPQVGTETSLLGGYGSQRPISAPSGAVPIETATSASS